MEENQITKDNLPEEFRPLGPWTYFWTNILYNIFPIGIIFCVIHAIGAKNINKRNFARSYFCFVIVVAIIIGVILLIGGGTSVITNLFGGAK